MPHGNKKSTAFNSKKKKGRIISTVDSCGNKSDAIPTSSPSSVTGTCRQDSSTPTQEKGHFNYNSAAGNDHAQKRNREAHYHIVTPEKENVVEWNRSYSSPTLSTSYTSAINSYQSKTNACRNATDNFKMELIQMVPASVFGNSNSSSLTDSRTANIPAHHLELAVEYIYEQVSARLNDNVHVGTGISSFSSIIAMDSPMIVSLKAAISMRKRVMKTHYDGGDEGHQHFYRVLKYCWKVLKEVILMQQQLEPMNSRSKLEEKAIAIPYQVFAGFAGMSSACDDDDDTDVDDDEDRSTITKHRPKRLSLSEVSYYEMILGEDYLYAIMLLHDMNEMMRIVSEKYCNFKKLWRNRATNEVPIRTLIQNIIDESILVNHFIKEVKTVESEIDLHFPYMNTIYRMMLFLMFPEIVKEFTETVSLILSSTSKSLVRKYTTHDSIAFLGDILETGFRNPSDERYKTGPIVTIFCTKWNISSAKIFLYVKQVSIIGRTRAPTQQEVSKNPLIMTTMETYQVKTHTWLARFPYIGGYDRSMMHTVRLLQGLSNVVKMGQPNVLQRGYFGRQWNEGRNMAKQITYDMDEFLMGDILPNLFSMCTGGVSKHLSMGDEALTLFTEMTPFTKSPEEPISWSLAFGIHALLTSVFEMQGQNDVEALGAMMKEIYLSRVEHLMQMVADSADRTMPTPHTGKLMLTTYLLYLLVKPVVPEQAATDDGGPDYNTDADRAIWNPLCCGLLMQHLWFKEMDLEKNGIPIV